MASPDLDASLAERLGGRWAISWQAAVITVPLGLAVITLSTQASADVAIWFLIALVAVGMGAGCTYLMHRTVFSHRAERPVAVSWVVTMAVVVGVLYTGTAASLGLVLQLLEPQTIAVQFGSLLVVVVSWGLLLTLVLDSQWRYRVHREDLIQQAVQRELASAQELDVLRDIRDSVQAEVGGQMRASAIVLVERIDALIAAGGADAAPLASQIRETARQTVRPLSHELEARARARHRTPGLLSGLVNIVRRQPFRPLAVSIVYVVTATPREVTNHGWIIGSGLLVVTVAFIFAIMTPLNQAMARWPRWHVPIYLAGLVIIQAPTVLLTPLRERVTGESIPVSDLVVTAVFGSIIVLATSAYGSWNRTRKEVIADFQREVDEGTITTLARGEALAKATMDAALVLHGSVQSSLYACALTIDEASRRGDIIEVNRALMQARAILENPDLGRAAQDSLPLAQALAEQVEQWSGLLAVSVSIDPAVEGIVGPIASHAASVVEEAIANAVHHGSASQVSVRMEGGGTDLVITVCDDGSGPGGGMPGLGSRLFSRLDDRWSLEPADGGSVLTVRLSGTTRVGAGQP